MQGLRKTPRNWKKRGGICAVAGNSGKSGIRGIRALVVIDEEEITEATVKEVPIGTVVTCKTQNGWTDVKDNIYLNGEVVATGNVSVSYDYTVTKSGVLIVLNGGSTGLSTAVSVNILETGG